VNPSLARVIEHIRQGTLDFVLVKPADAQFLVSTARFEPWKVTDLAAGVGILVWAFSLMGTAPHGTAIAASVVLLGVGTVLLYSTCIVAVAVTFWAVRLDNIAQFFNSLFDFGRWPIGLFKGLTRLVFTLLLPVALMTTYPAEALLGRLSFRTGAIATLGSLVFAIVCRLTWLRAIARYTSASS
jgi:ABC-2 type transport system permease protein